MAEETPIVIDTREQTEAHTLKLITSEHPEGMVFTVQPMGAGTYLKFMDKVKALQALQQQDINGKQLMKIQSDLCKLLVPLVSPEEEFAAWITEAEQKYPLAFQTVMKQIMRFVFGKAYF
jgi:hypothetical protein|nr:MAG TPA: hypothetical protein [Caudoviricetes sp.]